MLIRFAQVRLITCRSWSPIDHDPQLIRGHDITLLLEAARWAPSAGNSQPWAFIVGPRGSETHQRLVAQLAGSSADWAPTASLLVANLSHRLVEDTDWAYSEFSGYDLGQAVAHMTVQARALGLHVRQFRAVDRAGLAAEFGIPEHWQATTMSAIGRTPAHLGDPSDPNLATDPARRRRTVAEITWPTG